MLGGFFFSLVMISFLLSHLYNNNDFDKKKTEIAPRYAS